MDGPFHSPTSGSISLQGIPEEMFSYMANRPDSEYEVIIGSDSSSATDPTFPVAIVVLRKGEGGRFFLKRIRYSERRFYNVQERILEEVLLSCQLATWIRENFSAYVKESSTEVKYELKYIHADVGQNGVTKDMVKEVVGLIRGNGFEAKIKPDSFAASTIADKYS